MDNNIFKIIKTIINTFNKGLRAFKKRLVLYLITGIVLILVVAALIIFIPYFNKIGGTKIISAEVAGQKVVDYVNKNILGGEGKVSLKEITESSSMYKIKLNFEGEDQDVEAYVSRDGKYLFPVMPGIPIDLDQNIEPPTTIEDVIIGNFSVSKDDICKENGKPIIYFFGSQDCPHCKWEHPVVEDVAKKFEGQISFHNNIDIDRDGEVFSKYSDGGIPALVLGCKYYRVGSGENAGEEQEIKNLTALICKLTGNSPEAECNKVKDLIEQIKD